MNFIPPESRRKAQHRPPLAPPSTLWLQSEGDEKKKESAEYNKHQQRSQQIVTIARYIHRQPVKCSLAYVHAGYLWHHAIRFHYLGYPRPSSKPSFTMLSYSTLSTETLIRTKFHHGIIFYGLGYPMH